jgi:hypothetical protein
MSNSCAVILQVLTARLSSGILRRVIIIVNTLLMNDGW